MDFSYIKNNSSNSKVIIMLHWVWSNKEDLFWLSDFFEEEIWVFSLDWLFDLWHWRNAWYHLDFSFWKVKYDFNEVVLAWKYIVDFIDYIHEKYSVDYENIYLMWFSQWAIMSNYILSLYTDKIWWIISLSWRLLDEMQIEKNKIEDYKWKKIFIAHWTQDQVINIWEFEKLCNFYMEKWISVKSENYNIWHTIIKEEIDDIIEFIN